MRVVDEGTGVVAFRDALAQSIGLRFEEDRFPELREVLAARLRHSGERSVGAYLERLGTSDRERTHVAEALCVSETYFLRNPDQFRVLRAVLQQEHARPTGALRCLSAGCATGEEAYSIAMVASEALGGVEKVSVLGVDVSQRVLNAGQAGLYGKWALRETPPAVRQRYFHAEGDRFRISDEIRAAVRFEWQNLASPSSGFWKSGAFDVVFCRNMLMYLTPEAARGILEGIAEALVPGGYLFLGHAENLRGLSQAFALKHTHDTFYYQRESGSPAVARSVLAQTSPEPSHLPEAIGTRWWDVIADASRNIRTLSHGGKSTRISALNETLSVDQPELAPEAPRSALPQVMALISDEKFQEALKVIGDTPGASELSEVRLLRVVLLLITGQTDVAMMQCQPLLALDEFSAGAHYAIAMCLEQRGEHRASLEHSRVAAYLDPDFAMPHLQISRLARRGGDQETADRELALARRLLLTEGAERIALFGGGFTREGLLSLCDGEGRGRPS